MPCVLSRLRALRNIKPLLYNGFFVDKKLNVWYNINMEYTLRKLKKNLHDWDLYVRDENPMYVYKYTKGLQARYYLHGDEPPRKIIYERRKNLI